mmetsp:Transcript_22211/g.50420  ORF Transcript_22211/g.50420 Transcript_22211/m.50420 type:complete len:160 (+) Transcript_22211:232-711(+)
MIRRRRANARRSTSEIVRDEQIERQAAQAAARERNNATGVVLERRQLEIDEVHDVRRHRLNWRRSGRVSASVPDLSLKDMWMNPHDASTSQLLCAVLKCATVVASAIAIVGSLTYFAYKLSGSSISVNRPFINGGEWNYKYKNMRYDDVVVAERHDINP